MEWYWWALIVAGVAIIVWLKILLVPKFMKKMKDKREMRARNEEED